ncbi:MAG: F0F1 ATP synthase subunit epsilon [Rhodobacter sp.]|nr:F0F1 ATP synthase subunit epsilon [Rhodobacter sp.]
MADTLQFDLVSPERMLASMPAREVQIPGSEGDMTAMPDHMPVITTLRPGILRATGADGTQEFVVSGGFAEVTATSASVLAENAVPRSEVTPDFLEKLRKEAEEAHAQAAPEVQDHTAKALADLAHLADQMV